MPSDIHLTDVGTLTPPAYVFSQPKTMALTKAAGDVGP